MKTLIILSEEDIRRLSDDKHVAVYECNDKSSITVILSDKCYKAYMNGEYDIEANI